MIWVLIILQPVKNNFSFITLTGRGREKKAWKILQASGTAACIIKISPGRTLPIYANAYFRAFERKSSQNVSKDNSAFVYCFLG